MEKLNDHLSLASTPSSEDEDVSHRNPASGRAATWQWITGKGKPSGGPSVYFALKWIQCHAGPSKRWSQNSYDSKKKKRAFIGFEPSALFMEGTLHRCWFDIELDTKYNRTQKEWVYLAWANFMPKSSCFSCFWFVFFYFYLWLC